MLFNQLEQGGIRAIYDYDNTIFDDMVVPTGVDKTLVIDDIMMHHGDQPLHVPDPAVIKYYIKSWSTRKLAQWTRYKNLFDEEYDPLYNYNRTESRHLAGNDSLTGETHSSSGETVYYMDTDEHLVSAENSSDYEPDSKDVYTHDQSSHNITQGIADTKKLDKSEWEDMRAFGNIGVTTTQKMMREEMEVIPFLDIVRVISDNFAEEFCLGLW